MATITRILPDENVPARLLLNLHSAHLFIRLLKEYPVRVYIYIYYIYNFTGKVLCGPCYLHEAPERDLPTFFILMKPFYLLSG